MCFHAELLISFDFELIGAARGACYLYYVTNRGSADGGATQRARGDGGVFLSPGAGRRGADDITCGLLIDRRS